jgi:hypothetical protein
MDSVAPLLEVKYQAPQETAGPRLGVEDSNLGIQIQSLLSYH